MPEDMLPKDIKLESVHTLQTDKIVPPPIKLEPVRVRERNVFPEPVPESSHLVRNILVTLLIIIALTGSGIAIFSYSHKKSQEAPVSVEPAIKKQQLISYDSVKEITFSSQELSDKSALGIRIYNEARTSGTGVTFYKLNSELKDILSVLSPSIPSELTRSLVDKKDFFGGYVSGNFLILTFDSHDLAYAGMLKWEASMNKDLSPLFSIPSSETISGFQDKIVANKDARIAVDPKGNTLFLYGFYDPTTLIFAKNEEIFKSLQDMLLRKNL